MLAVKNTKIITRDLQIWPSNERAQFAEEVQILAAVKRELPDHFGHSLDAALNDRAVRARQVIGESGVRRR